MPELTTVKVSKRCQISLPGAARKALNIEAGDRLLVDIQDGLILLIPQPRSYVPYLSGLHRELWEGVDTDAYLSGERAET